MVPPADQHYTLIEKYSICNLFNEMQIEKLGVAASSLLKDGKIESFFIVNVVRPEHAALDKNGTNQSLKENNKGYVKNGNSINRCSKDTCDRKNDRDFKDIESNENVSVPPVGIYCTKCPKSDDWLMKFNADDTILAVTAYNSSTAANWILRNVLYLMKYHYNLKRIRLMQYKVELNNLQNPHPSTILDIDLSNGSNREPDMEQVANVNDTNTSQKFSACTFRVTGFEKYYENNGITSKKSDWRVLNLANMMDKKQLTSNAVDLNLKLMRWRLLPGLKLERISSLRCLILGAGTLGCQVARNLMAWGVRHITFVDHANISLSNPVRQWLYTYEDACEELMKSDTAASRMCQIFPQIDCRGVNLMVPTPGRYDIKGDDSNSMDKAYDTIKSSIEKLEEEIEECDVVFSLMDSRESRWLPTVIAAAKEKLVITAALGLDNFVVMRHGLHKYTKSMAREEKGRMEEKERDKKRRQGSPSSDSLGCYFCNDVIVPRDSSIGRTLDQQCTVTRPGLSGLASSTAVELFINLIHHPLGADAPADSSKIEIGNSTSTCMGIVPQQIRGFINYFTNLTIVGQRYEKCVACSNQIVEKYLMEGITFLLKALCDPTYLEDISGLTSMMLEQTKLDTDEIERMWDDDLENEDESPL